jgi:hypothetical protein
MSRERVHEVSSPISLFPFIGILLCTMGALLVVLVAVSRSARTSAEEQVAKKQQAATASADDGPAKKLADVQQYVGALTQLRTNAEQKLRDEHARLSHVEDHIRRMQERLRSLQAAGTELEALEKEHYDDREQGEREAERLNQLIEESRKSIASLQDAANREPTSYALVPYEGPNGTFRRPIYIECVKDAIILQPEGVRIPAEDLRSPVGAGNPLAAALRATRDHLVQLYPKEGQGRDTEPYPLLLVRPDGLFMFDRARQAIEAGDFELGFELVEQDWKLKYPQADPQLASIEEQAIQIARARQQLLAEAAPRAYRGGSHSFDEQSGSDGTDGGGDGGDEAEFAGGDYGDASGGGGGGGDGYGYGGGGGAGEGGSGGRGGSGGGGGGAEVGIAVGQQAGGSGNGSGTAQAAGGDNYPSSSFGTSGVSGTGPGGEGSGLAGGDGSNSMGGSFGDGMNGAVGGSHGSSSGPGGSSLTAGGSAYGAGGGSEFGESAGVGARSGGMAGVAPSGGGSGAGSSDGGIQLREPSDATSPDADNATKNVSVMMGASAPADPASAFDSAAPRDRNRTIPPDQRGKDWAVRQKPQRAVAVRRTIRVVVRQNQLAILPDGSANPATVAAGRVVPLSGDTVESVDQFVKQVHAQIDGWGIAGNGLYWRPVIILAVGPDGQKRADDLARLLKNSGLEIRANETASKAPQGQTHETR